MPFSAISYFWVEFAKKLEFLIFRRCGLTKYTQRESQRIVMRCHLIRGSLLQLQHITDLLATDKSRYFAQPCSINVKCLSAQNNY